MRSAKARLERAKGTLEKVVRFHPRLSFRQIAFVMKTLGWSGYMALKARRELEQRAKLKALARKNERGQLYQVWVLEERI